VAASQYHRVCEANTHRHDLSPANNSNDDDDDDDDDDEKLSEQSQQPRETGETSPPPQQQQSNNPPGIRELVKRIIQILPLNLILHGDINIHKYVILGLGLAPAVNLLDTKRHPPCDRLPKATADTVEAGLSHEPS